MASWMKELAAHYQQVREAHPDDDLMIVFDIDNTIIDMRHMIEFVLRLYDRRHQTGYFSGLRAEQLDINENQVELLLESRGVPDEARDDILAWYMDKRWTTEAILTSHRPFTGVMEVLRWFQLQPRTYIGLNTGRPEDLREDTLRSLNKLGKRFKVDFREDLLFMYREATGGPVTDSKVRGIQRFQEMGFRVFAMVDNEPDNLESVARFDPSGAILPVHADTIFDSKRSQLPDSSVSGSDYDLTELISDRTLPRHVQFVWHGVNDEVNLRQAVASDVKWQELDARFDTTEEHVVLRHDGYERRPMAVGETLLTLREVVPRLLRAGKSVKIDLKEGGNLPGAVARILRDINIDEDRLWINGDLDTVGKDTFRQYAQIFPGAILQCPLRSLAAVVLSSPDRVKARLQECTTFGINRFSVRWGVDDLGQIVDRLFEWGYEVNIYNVPDLESFLKAVLVLPTSITSDFNFPKWHYFGRGPGENSTHHTYTLDGD